MFARIVSLVLIAAIIACPLSCGSGVCHGSQCCAERGRVSENQCLHPVCSQPATADSDCCHESSHDTGKPIPPPCPAKSSCQGICGGAVIEKPCEPDTADASILLPPACTDDAFVSLQAVFRRDVIRSPECVRGDNQGRFVRTLHMSLIC